MAAAPQPEPTVLLRRRRRRTLVSIALLAVLLLVSIPWACTIGYVDIPLGGVVRALSRPLDSSLSRQDIIILDVRLPRVILAALVGGALALSGCTMQGLFKNPMASPYILGISSGAAFGAALATLLGGGLALGVFAIPLSAFLFSTIAVFTVYLIARRDGTTPVETLLLAGIAIGLFFSAAVSFLKYVADESDLRTIVFWLMGGLWASNWQSVAVVAAPIVITSIALTFLARRLNVMVLGEEHALNLGVNVERLKTVLLLFASLLASSAVCFVGIVGFVGLIVPHVMRLIVGPDHRVLLPCSALGGGLFLVWADTVARTIAAPTEVPVGIITGLLGSVFFVFLLRRRKQV